MKVHEVLLIFVALAVVTAIGCGGNNPSEDSNNSGGETPPVVQELDIEVPPGLEPDGTESNSED